MSLVLRSTGGKSHLVHFIDTPGHVNFVDEIASAIRLVDGIVLVVDVVEGVSYLTKYEKYLLMNLQVMCNTEAIIKHAIQENIKITLVVNKIDRLTLELRLKPADAFYKIKTTIEEVNNAIRYMPLSCLVYPLLTSGNL